MNSTISGLNDDPIITQMTSALDILSDDKKSKKSKSKSKKLSTKEKKFRENADAAFKMSAFVCSSLIAAAPLFCPPLAYVAAIALLLTTALHYYDVRNDYKLSHSLDKLLKKLNNKLKHHDKNTKEVDEVDDKELTQVAKIIPFNKKDKEVSNDKTSTPKQKSYVKFANNVSTFFNKNNPNNKIAQAAEIYEYCAKFKR